MLPPAASRRAHGAHVGGGSVHCARRAWRGRAGNRGSPREQQQRGRPHRGESATCRVGEGSVGAGLEGLADGVDRLPFDHACQIAGGRRRARDLRLVDVGARSRGPSRGRRLHRDRPRPRVPRPRRPELAGVVGRLGQKAHRRRRRSGAQSGNCRGGDLRDVAAVGGPPVRGDRVLLGRTDCVHARHQRRREWICRRCSVLWPAVHEWQRSHRRLAGKDQDTGGSICRPWIRQ